MAALLTGLQPWWFESEGEVADGARPFLDLAPYTVVERLAACGYDTARFRLEPESRVRKRLREGIRPLRRSDRHVRRGRGRTSATSST
jgi:hypothetical protein